MQSVAPVEEVESINYETLQRNFESLLTRHKFVIDEARRAQMQVAGYKRFVQASEPIKQHWTDAMKKAESSLLR